MTRGLPRRITCVLFSADGLSRTGFIAASGSTRAAVAWAAWARPISAPSLVTNELSAMFCALNGATLTPSRASQRQIPATTTLFPASEWVPATSSAPLTGAPPLRRRSRRHAPLGSPPARRASQRRNRALSTGQPAAPHELRRCVSCSAESGHECQQQPPGKEEERPDQQVPDRRGEAFKLPGEPPGKEGA